MLETIFTGIGSLFLRLISYSYNAWRHTVKENRKVYLQYLWRLSLLIDWIVKNYLSQTANDVTNNTKSN